MSKNKNDSNEKILFLGELVDLKTLGGLGFRIFIRVSDTKEASKNLVNRTYPTPRRTVT